LGTNVMQCNAKKSKGSKSRVMADKSMGRRPKDTDS
jgi:hypothetical protein